MPPQDNTGSFGSAIGGVDALKAAMQRRGIDTGILDQITPGAPGPASPVAPQVPQTNPQVGNIPQGGQTAVLGPETAMGAGPNEDFRSAEMAISLKALKGVVDTENAIAKSALKLQGLV